MIAVLGRPGKYACYTNIITASTNLKTQRSLASYGGNSRHGQPVLQEEWSMLSNLNVHCALSTGIDLMV